MKHLFKISYLIIFAAIVASVSTSCGNDSELFDEPVMYQTRAMTRANIGGEYYSHYQEGDITQPFTIIEGKVSATIYLKWGPNNSANPAVQSCFLTPYFIDTDYYNLIYSNSTPKVDVNKKEVSVEFIISSVSQKVYDQNGNLIDTIQHNLIAEIDNPIKVKGELKKMGEK